MGGQEAVPVLLELDVGHTDVVESTQVEPEALGLMALDGATRALELKQELGHVQPPRRPQRGAAVRFCQCRRVGSLPNERDYSAFRVGVIIKATHHCMTTRGVHKPGTDLVTSRMLGCFRDSALTRQEFLGMAS